MRYRECLVTFRDDDGAIQKAHVDAPTAFEAAALALKFWSTRRYVQGPGKRAVLEVEVDTPARRLVAVKMTTLLDWLYKRKPKTQEEAVRIQRLRALLADDRR